MKENLFVLDDCLMITCTFYLDRFLWISLDVKQWLHHAPLWAPVCWTDEGDEGFPVLTGGSLYPRDRYLLARTKWMEEWWFHLNSLLREWGHVSFLLFSSPELKAQVSISDHFLSVVCDSPSFCPSVCKLFTFFIFFSRTTGPISIKLGTKQS